MITCQPASMRPSSVANCCCCAGEMPLPLAMSAPTMRRSRPAASRTTQAICLIFIISVMRGSAWLISPDRRSEKASIESTSLPPPATQSPPMVGGRSLFARRIAASTLMRMRSNSARALRIFVSPASVSGMPMFLILANAESSAALERLRRVAISRRVSGSTGVVVSRPVLTVPRSTRIVCIAMKRSRETLITAWMRSAVAAAGGGLLGRYGEDQHQRERHQAGHGLQQNLDRGVSSHGGNR